MFLKIAESYPACKHKRTLDEKLDYQEDFVTPGILPASANSRNWIRETPNFRINARGRPLIEQRFFTRTADEFRGIFCSFFESAKNSSSVVAGLTKAALISARFAACLATSKMRFLLRSIADVFGMAGGNYVVADLASTRRNGIPKSFNSSRPSSSVDAVVTIVMSSPIDFLTFSTVISGNIVKSETPRL